MSILAGILEFLSFGWLTGPIFSKEVRTASRRGQYYWLRLCYIGLLAAYVATVWTGAVEDVNPATAEGQARIAHAGKTIVGSIVWFQFLAMQIFAIVLMSDSISGEITGRTITVLMTTPITSLQIVAGKLLGGMLHIFLLLAISLPLLAILRVLGGIPWDYLAAGLCLTLCASLLAGTLTMLLSVRIRQPYVTIMLAAAIAIIFFGVALFVSEITTSSRGMKMVFFEPVGGLYFITDEFMSSEPLSVEKWVIPCITTFCAFVVILRICVLQVGRLALRREQMKELLITPDVRRDDLAGELTRLERISGKSPPPQLLAPARTSPVQPPPSPAQQSSRIIDELRVAASTASSERVLELDYRPISEIRANPVLWREMNKGAIKWSAWMRCITLYISIPLVIAVLTITKNGASCLAALAVIAIGLSVFHIFTSRQRAKHIISLLIALTTLPLLLLPQYLEWVLLLFCSLATAVPAATNIASEKESRTLELLYTTGLTDWKIMSGKAGGVFLKCWTFWLCLLIIPFSYFVIHAQYDLLRFILASLLTGTLLTFVISLGQFCSVRCNKSTSAVSMCVTILAAIWVVFPLMGYIGYYDSNLSRDIIRLFSPVQLMVPGILLGHDQRSADISSDYIMAYLETIATYLILSAIMLLLVKLLLRRGIYQQK
ncbi:MAG: ABC transporter permease subunit [Planctomycetes bacterium]|nr:ABC transporter permease subunit [Planctomycetota bacterium]